MRFCLGCLPGASQKALTDVKAQQIQPCFTLHTWACLLQASGFTEQLSQGPSSSFTEQPSREPSVNGAAGALRARGQTIEDSDEEDGQGDTRVGGEPQFDAEATWKDRLDEDDALGGEDYD